MTRQGTNQALGDELTSMLEPRFPGIAVEIGQSQKWDRPCATFRWSGFSDLLPEERFQRLASVIPKEFRRKRLAGYVWLELADTETLDEFLAHPRSEDVESQEGEIYAQLIRNGFFRLLGETLGPSPERACGGDFDQTVVVLEKKKTSADNIRNTKLAFIRHGVYCDCQVLQSAESAMAKLHAGAA